MKWSCLMFFLFFQSMLFSNGHKTHWFEAEEFKGNSTVVKSDSASGGAYVEGKTWYCMVSSIPFPQDGQSYNVWVRIQSDVPANWYLYENGEKKKAFAWFYTEKPDEWTWVKIGRFSSNIGETFWPIYLQRPRDQNIPTATGRIDVVVVTQEDDVNVLEDLLVSRLAYKAVKPPADNEREKVNSLVASRRVADIPYIETPPVINGILDDAVWKKAARITDFTLIDGRSMAAEQTVGYMAYDRDNFYIAAEMMENQISFLRKVRNIRNDSVWQDDCVEIFIDPGFTQKEFLHFIINPLGTRQDNLAVRLDRVTAVGEKGVDWTAAASIGTDRWVVEVAIPWILLDSKMPEKGEIWGFNMNREERPRNELSHWNYVGGQFHQPDRFGLISFGSKPATLEMVTFAEMSREVSFSLRANDEKSKNLSVLMTLKEKDAILSHESRVVTVEKDSATKISFPLSLDKPGSYILSAVIKDDAATLYELSFPFKTYSESLVSVAWPPEMRDGKLYIALNTAQHCFFLFANHFPDKKSLSRPQFIVSVPAGVKILDPTDSVLVDPTRYNKVVAWEQNEEKRNGQIYHRYVFSLERGIPPSRIESVRFFQNSLVLFFMLDNGAFGPNTEIPVYFSLKAEGVEEEENMFHLVTLPEVAGRQPKKILIHNWLWTFNEGPHIWQPYLDTMKVTGFNAISSSTQDYYVREARKRRMLLINNLWWFWWNNEYLKENPDDIAVTFEGKKDSSANPYVCLTVMLKDDGALIRKSIERYAREVANGLADGYVWDLEHPGVWNVCFCGRCLEEFRKFAGIPLEEKLTPKKIREKYANKWILFATRQSSLTSKVIREELRKNNPDILWGVYSGMPGQMTMESYRCNWEEIANFIDVAYPTGYSNSPSALNDRFITGWKEFIRMIKDTANSGNKVKVIPTLTAGYERGEALQPSAELLRMQILRSVASGADGISIWWWGPMDGRYYYEIARATALIAEFEEFFLNGKRTTDILQMEEHPYGASVSWEVFALGKKLLVLIFNHSSDETRKLNFAFRNIPANSSGHFYPTGKKIDTCRKIQVEIKPLETAVLVLELS